MSVAPTAQSSKAQSSEAQSLEASTPRRAGGVLPEVGRLTQPLLPLALALGTAAGCLAMAVSQADPTESAEGRLLTLLAAGVVACAAFAAQLGGGKWMALPAGGSLLALTCLWLLHQGPQRGASVVLVLTVTLAAGLARSWTRVEAGAWGTCLAWTTSLAVGVQLLVRPDLLLPARVSAGGLFGRLWVEGVALPALFGIGLGLLAASLGRPALLAGVAILLAGPGVDVPRLTILGPALTLALGVVWLWRRSGFEARWPTAAGRLESTAARGLLAVGVLVVALSSYPWIRTSPWRSLAELVPPRVAAVPHERGILVLRADSDPWRHELAEPIAVSQLALDSSLVHGVGATGQTVAVLEARNAAGAVVVRWPLVGGDDTAEWAAARSDVQSLEGFRAPTAWNRWVPPGGGFFAHRYRAHLVLDQPAELASLELRVVDPARLDSTQTAKWELHLARLELRR